MTKFNIDLNNYPNLKQLHDKDVETFIHVLKNIMLHMDNAVKNNHLAISRNVYKTDYVELFTQIMNAFFNAEGIADKHYNDAEKEGLKQLGENLHPLALFTKNIPVFDAQGRNISPFQHLQDGTFNIEDWLYSLFYGARFVSWQELAEYLTLGEYDLIDVLKAQNFNNIAPIQEQLEIQKQKNIPVGKLIKGTGRLDLGD